MKASHFRFIGLAAVFALIGTSACSPSGGKAAGRAMAGVPVNAAETIQKDEPLEIPTVGRVEAIQSVSVKALVGGEVTRVYFKEGQDVKKGARLFTIDPRPFEIALKQAEALLEKDRALLENAQSDMARYGGLVKKDYVTKEQYDALVANRDVLAATVKADEANVANARLQLGYTVVSSPLDGRTGSLLIDAGNIIKANDVNSAVVIYQMSPIYVTFSVPEQNLPSIRKYMAEAPLRTDVTPAGSSQAPVSGILTFVDNAIDQATGTITLKATFENTDESLWPGEFLNVRLVLTTEKGVTVVPSQAVQTGQNGLYVYVIKPDMTVDMKAVTVSRTFGQDSIISGGLKPGERVVTDGQLRLVPGAKVEIKSGL